VTRIDAAGNAVYVGKKEDALCREIEVSGINWLRRPETAPAGVFRATAKVRSMMKDMPATVETKGDSARVVFDEPLWAPAPGQSAVFYEGDIVTGGGIIADALVPVNISA